MLNFLLCGGFLYPRTPAEPINHVPRGWVTLCGAVSRLGVKRNVSVPGLGHTNKKSAVRVVRFFLVGNTLKDF